MIIFCVFDINVRVCVVKKKLVKFFYYFFFQINFILSDKFQFVKEFSFGEIVDFILVMEFIDFIFSIFCVFKCVVFVKFFLLIGVEVEEENDDIVVFQKIENGWELVDLKYKFIRIIVMFDIKFFMK